MQTINTENVYLDVPTLRLISFWRKKSLKDDVRTSFNLDLYIRKVEIKNS